MSEVHCISSKCINVIRSISREFVFPGLNAIHTCVTFGIHNASAEVNC